MMKQKQIILCLMLMLCICVAPTFGQSVDKKDIIGTWEIEGAIMGNNGEGWVMPHKHSAPDCGKDHTVFSADGNGKEVIYTASCDPVEEPFQWKLEDAKLIFSKGEKSITWHLLSLEDGQLKVGVQVHPNSERKMYVAYKKNVCSL